LCYTIFTDSGGVVPALKRRNSEGRAKKKLTKPILSNKNRVEPNIENCPYTVLLVEANKKYVEPNIPIPERRENEQK
jgi:hypothetical protein